MPNANVLVSQNEGVPMRHAALATLASIVLLCGGCDMRMLSPRWHSLVDKGVNYVPGEYGSAAYLAGCSDKQFAAAVEDLRKVKIWELNFQNTELTDQSIDGVLRLDRLQVLYVNGADFSANGLVRLSALPRLRRLYVAEGQFSEGELSRIADELPEVRVSVTPTGAYRYENRNHADGDAPTVEGKRRHPQ